MTLYDPVQIVNLALSELGDRRITSLDDKSETARAAKDFYYHAYGATLEAHEWRFAMRQAQLQQRSGALSGATQIQGTDTYGSQVLSPSGAPTFYRYAYQYNMPPAWRRWASISDSPDLDREYQEFSQTGDYLSANAPQIYVEYVAEDWPESAFPSHFVTCMALKLAYYMAPRIQGNANDRAPLEEKFNKTALPQSRAIDSQGTRTKNVVRSQWQDARFGGRSNRGGRYR